MAWPSTLPIPTNTSYSGNDELPVIRTPMEQGAARVTRVSSVYMTDLQVQCILTNEQLGIYRTYFAGSECQAGAGWFDMDIATGETVVAHQVRITSSRWNRAGNRWVLSLGLETDEHN